MSYGFDENTPAGSGTFLKEAGIHDVTLPKGSVTVESLTPNGSPLLMFNFKTAKGDFRLVIWDVNVQRESDYARGTFTTETAANNQPKDKNGNLLTVEQFVEQKVNEAKQLIGRNVVHILSAWEPNREKLRVKADGYLDFAHAVAKLATGLALDGNGPDGQPVSLLTVYDGKDYVTVPRFPDFIGPRAVLEAVVKAGKPQYYRMTRNKPDAEAAKATASGGFSQQAPVQPAGQPAAQPAAAQAGQPVGQPGQAPVASDGADNDLPF